MKFKKIIARILIKASILSLCISLLFIQSTSGYFQDIEVSQDNTIEAGTLDLSLRSGQSNFVSGADSMEPGDSVARDIYVQNVGNLPFQYNAHSEPIGGSCDQDLYNELELKVWYNWYFEEPNDDPPGYHKSRQMFLKYNGLLKDFNLRALDPNDSDLQIPGREHFNNKFYSDNEHWFYYQITLPEGTGYLLDKSCTFNIKVKAWQVGLEESESGFWDEEVIESIISTKQRCSEGKEAIDVAPIDRVNIGDELSEQLHDIEGWSSPNLPGGYGGGSDDGTYRQIIEETSCDEDSREAKFVLYAGNHGVNLLRIRALDGLSDLDSFEIYVNDNLVGTYNDIQDSTEVWHTLEIPLNNLSGYLEVKLKAVDEIWDGCSQYGQVAISWAEIDGYYCSPDEAIMPALTEATCQEPNTPVVVDPIEEINIGDILSESGHNLLGWSSHNLPGNYGGKDDGTYRQIISEQYCSNEYRVAGFTLNTGSQIANLLRLKVLDGISNKDGFDVYVNDEFLAHLPDLTQNHSEQWQIYEIPLPNLSGEIKIRLVGFDEFWDWCETYGQVAVSWAQIAGFTCGEAATTEYLVINEVYYDTEGTDSNEEWIEIYNPTNSTVDLSNYKLGDEETQGGTEGMYQFPQGASIGSEEPDSFIVVAQNATAFNARYGYYPDYEFSDHEASTPDMSKYSGWSNGIVALSNTGDEALLLNESDIPVDVVVWESGSYSGVIPHSGVVTGHSIARVQKGVDTDDCSVDFYDNTNPNPGTNPHSHIVVSINQEDNHLLVAFSNAAGFDNLKYAVSYNHVFEANPITELVEGEASKPIDESQLILTPLFFGTCSSQGLVCTPHLEIENIIINLIYKKGSEILGQEQINYVWQ